MMRNGMVILVIIALVFVGVADGGALVTISTGNGSGQSSSTAPTSSTTTSASNVVLPNSSNPYMLTIVITTENLFNATIGTQPAFFVQGPNGLQSSANIALPAHRLIEVIIMNFDQGNASLVGPQYENVTGTINDTMTFYNNNAMNATEGPSGIMLQGAQTVTSLAPPKEEYLSHTFTVPSIGLNIPIAAESTEVAYFATGGPGTYTWLCESLCGSGDSGLGGYELEDLQ